MSTLDIQSLLDISELPGITGEDVEVYKPLQLVEVESNPNDRQPDLEDDYSMVRKNMHFQSQMLMDAAKIFLETAKNADSPRHMEVFSTLMGQMTTTNKEILKLHKEMKDITDEKTNTKNQGGQVYDSTATTVFTGSPTDLMDEVGDSYEAQEAAANEEKLINASS